MKATGIIRRIDDLGRVVIPKEIRRTLRLKDGDPLEIFTDSSGAVIFRKYEMLNEMEQLAQAVAKNLSEAISEMVFIANTDEVIAVDEKYPASRKALGEKVNLEYSNSSYVLLKHDDHNFLTGINCDFLRQFITVFPITHQGDLIGTICVSSNYELTETQKAIAKVMAKMLTPDEF